MSKQIVKHGAALEIPTLEELARLIAESRDERAHHDYRAEKGTFQMDGTGAFSGSILAADRQHDRILERISVFCGGNQLAQIGFYSNTFQPTDLLETVKFTATNSSVFGYSDAFSNNIILPAGDQLMLTVSGGLVSTQGAWRIQTRYLPAKRS